MFGKNKCKILKEIRQRIADENDIPYVTHECSFRGECAGTCPRCEQELRYLEQQLARRQRLGKAVVVTALCASMSLGVTGCDPKVNEVVGDVPMTQATMPTVDPDSFWNSPDAPIDELEGEPTELPSEDWTELEGDVAYEPGKDTTSDGGTSAGSSGQSSGTKEQGSGSATASEGKQPSSTDDEDGNPSEGLPIVLPPDEFGD